MGYKNQSCECNLTSVKKNKIITVFHIQNKNLQVNKNRSYGLQGTNKKIIWEVRGEERKVINRKLWGMRWVMVEVHIIISRNHGDLSNCEKQIHYHNNPWREEPRKCYHYIQTFHRKTSQGYKRILRSYLLPVYAL